MPNLQKIGLGGGCHWCTEGVFVHLRGVHEVEQGWIASEAPDEAYSEAIIVHYDPKVISYQALIEVHLETHAAWSDHPMRAKYRSAVYYFGEAEQTDYERVLAEINRARPGLCSRVLAHKSFRRSLPEHRDYYRADPERPFCKTYIRPKLRELRRRRPKLMN